MKGDPTMRLNTESALPAVEDRFFEAPSLRSPGAAEWERAPDWYHYTTGYRDAADILMANLEAAGRGAYKLAPPIVFLYRHHLELALKQLARQCGSLLGRDVPPQVDHRVNALWRLCLALLEEESPGSTGAAEVQQTTRLLDEFCRVDLKSETFRYPEDQEGNPWSWGLNEIVADRVQEVVDKISLLLDCISTELSTR